MIICLIYLRLLTIFYGVGHAAYAPWQPLQQGAVIDLVAPSSEYSNTRVEKVVQMLTKQGFQPPCKVLATKSQSRIVLQQYHPYAIYPVDRSPKRPGI